MNDEQRKLLLCTEFRFYLLQGDTRVVDYLKSRQLHLIAPEQMDPVVLSGVVTSLRLILRSPV